jgi:tripartite-type tricarboxylate transporter receptor subunit TctC
MKLPRRTFLRLAAGAAALPAVSRGAMAQTYPTRPVRIIVGFAAGGPNDIAARVVGQWLSEHLGKPFVVENRPGAASNIATEQVVRARPDGYTLVIMGPPAVLNKSLYDNLNFSFVRDIAPVAGIVRAPEVLLVNPSIPASSVPEFIAYAKANPGKLNMATAGNGTMPHVAGELFKLMAGVDLVTVGYRGGAPALVDLLSGHMHVMFETPIATITHVRAGKLRALAVTSATRSEVLPDVPVMADFIPGFEASAWYGLGAPKDTPAEVIDTLNRSVNAGLADATIKQRLAELGGAPMPLSPAELAKLIADDTEKWGKVIRTAKIKPD